MAPGSHFSYAPQELPVTEVGSCPESWLLLASPILWVTVHSWKSCWTQGREDARGDRRSEIRTGTFTGSGRGDELAGPTENKLRKNEGQEYEVMGEQKRAAGKMRSGSGRLEIKGRREGGKREGDLGHGNYG